MHPALALELTTTVLVIVAALSVVLLLLIIVAPWRQVRDEPPLDPAVEAKLLLHRNPDEPTGEVPRVTGVPDAEGEESPDSDADFGDLSDLADVDDEQRRAP
jgi:hypothetical protein